MSDLETDMDWFDDEHKKTNQVNDLGNEQQKGKVSSVASSNGGNDGYETVYTDRGDAKGASGEILIETAIKGFLYRCEVFKGGALIDGREINCKDLVGNEEKAYIFKEKYMATHNTFKLQYIAEEFFKEFASTEGDSKDEEEEHCKVVTSYSEDSIRSVIYAEGEEFEVEELKIKENIKGKKNLIEKKVQLFHLENILKYIAVEKFPVNISWLNSILKKLPFYTNKPMHAFYLFLVLMMLLLVIVKFAYCGYLGTQKNAKLANNYFAESLCHVMEERCLESKEEGWGKGIKPTMRQCMGYRKNTRIFSKEAYDKIFPKEDIEKQTLTCQNAKEDGWKDKEVKESCQSLCKENVIDKSICAKAVISYTITPSFLNLNFRDAQPIYLSNQSNRTLVFKVEQITLEDDSLPKIVRIINLEESRTLEPSEEDSVKFGLIESAGQNYENGSYTGNIKIGVMYDGKHQTKDIKFKFDVNF